MVAGSLAAVTEVYGEVQRAAGAAERIRELLATESEITSPQALPGSTGLVNEVPESASETPLLQFENVNFSYPSRPNMQAIKGLNLNVKSGQRIALVGPSGAGKSTLFDLLLRFRDPNSGRILISGQDVTEMDLHELRNLYALVPQQPVLFSSNVLDNIRFGKPDATEQEVIDAAKAAHAHEFIEQLPKGYQSFLGEQGVKLSGGQKQRLAIARAILRNPKILLLDEATSALDAQSEHLVQKALDVLMRDRTTLIIAHRFATVAHVDAIAVFDQGELVDMGTHQQLMTSSELYSQLAKLQFRDNPIL